MIILMQRDIPEGMTASEVIQLTLGPEALEQLVVIIKTEEGLPSPRQSLAHVQRTPMTHEDCGKDQMTVLRSLAAKCGMWIENTDDGIVAVDDTTRRLFTDIGQAIAVLRTRLSMSKDSRENVR